MLLAVDLDGVLADLGPGVARRIAARFGVQSHPSTWRAYDLRLLRLGVPEARLSAFLEETFADPSLYLQAPVVEGAARGLATVLRAGWEPVGLTARAGHLAEVTRSWLARHGLALSGVHHCPLGGKAAVAAELGAGASIEDNPAEAELLGEVCDSWLLDRPYNRDQPLRGCRRVLSWDDAVGRLCQLQLFA